MIHVPESNSMSVSNGYADVYDVEFLPRFVQLYDEVIHITMFDFKNIEWSMFHLR